MDEDDEQIQEVDPDKDLPRFRLRFSDLPIDKVKAIVRSEVLTRKP